MSSFAHNVSVNLKYCRCMPSPLLPVHLHKYKYVFFGTYRWGPCFRLLSALHNDQTSSFNFLIRCMMVNVLLKFWFWHTTLEFFIESFVICGSRLSALGSRLSALGSLPRLSGSLGSTTSCSYRIISVHFIKCRDRITITACSSCTISVFKDLSFACTSKMFYAYIAHSLLLLLLRRCS